MSTWRLAILSDIHGHKVALEAVLADIEAQGGADAYWVLGDLVAFGPEPVAVLERLATLPQTSFIYGNTDAYVVSGRRPGLTLEQAQSDPAALRRVWQEERSFSWTEGATAAAGWRPWLEELPLELRLTLPDGTRLLGVHASPGTAEGNGLHPGMSAAQMATITAGCEADIVCIGHTHAPFISPLPGGPTILNPGAVGLPWGDDPRPSYALLTAGAATHHLTLRRVDYDRAAAIAAVERVRHPAAPFIVRWLMSEMPPPWRSQA